MNMSSVTNTLLNLLILTGVPFSGTTIRSSNSFSDPIIGGANAPFPNLSIDYSFMNPPYGGDKSKGKEYKFAYTKGKGTAKQYLVNDDIKSIGIEDDDKVSAGVQLAMATLSSEGVCCIVLPQGFFFGASKKCIELRKKLAEEYKIWYIVEIASGAFLNTGTKTSMMVFQKGVGGTETVSFIGLDEKVLVEASLEELRGKNYSLNYKQYLPQSSVEIDGFEMVKLGDILEFQKKSGKLGSADGKDVGKYPFYTCAQKKMYVDTCEFTKTCIIVNRGGLMNVRVDKNFSVSHDDIHVLSWIDGKTTETTAVYVAYYLQANMRLLSDGMNGTTLKHLNKSFLEGFEIPLPSLERQQEIVDSIDGFSQLAHAEEQSLKLLEKSVMFEVKWMGMGKERVKLGDIAQFTFGYGIKSEDFGQIGLPIIKTKNFKDSQVTILNPNPRTNNKYDDKYLITHGDLLMVVDGACGESAIWRENENGWLNQHVSKLTISNETTRMYIAYIMKGEAFKEYIQSHIVVTTIPHMQRDVAKNFETPLPTLTEQQTLQSDFDEIRHKHAKIAEYKAKAQQAIRRLIPGANTEIVLQETKSSEAHSSQCQVKEDSSGCTCHTQLENNIEEKEELVVAVQPAPVKIKKTVVRKSIKPVDVKQETEESIVAAQPAPIKRKIVKRIIEE
jgi:type I restriction enzyme S subunit